MNPARQVYPPQPLDDAGAQAAVEAQAKAVAAAAAAAASATAARAAKATAAEAAAEAQKGAVGSGGGDGGGAGGSVGQGTEVAAPNAGGPVPPCPDDTAPMEVDMDVGGSQQGGGTAPTAAPTASAPEIAPQTASDGAAMSDHAPAPQPRPHDVDEGDGKLGTQGHSASSGKGSKGEAEEGGAGPLLPTSTDMEVDEKAAQTQEGAGGVPPPAPATEQLSEPGQPKASNTRAEQAGQVPGGSTGAASAEEEIAETEAPDTLPDRVAPEVLAAAPGVEVDPRRPDKAIVWAREAGGKLVPDARGAYVSVVSGWGGARWRGCGGVGWLRQEGMGRGIVMGKHTAYELDGSP